VANFSQVKALEQEIADLKADIVYLSGKVTDDAQKSESDGEQHGEEPGLLHVTIMAALLGLVAGWLMRGRRA
jgi:hypothetical protein